MEEPYVFIETKAYTKAADLLHDLAYPKGGGIKPVLPALCGGMGVGKTSTAIHAACSLAKELGPSTKVLYCNAEKFVEFKWNALSSPHEFLALALWAKAMVGWIRGMDEMHRRITTSVVLFAVSATSFFMLLWHRLDRAGLFNAAFSQPIKGGSWDICTVCHGFLLLVLFYGVAQAIFNRRYK